MSEAIVIGAPLPGFEPGSQAPEARVLSKLYYGGIELFRLRIIYWCSGLYCFVAAHLLLCP